MRHVKTNTDPDIIVGLTDPDDAAVLRISDDLAIVQTVDFFTPIVDDPFAWGRIAAANALSDIYAMGGQPRFALNLIGWPRQLDFEILGRVLEGSGEACAEAGVVIVGGHSVDDPEPKYGLAVTGTIHPNRIVRKGTIEPPAELVLTKPLGMGIIATGIKEQKTSAPTAAEAQRIMGTLNRASAAAMVEVGVQAATDITGFGLTGHLLEMLGDRRDARLYWTAIPVLEEALELVASGAWPGGSRRNLASLRDKVDAGGLDDPQLKVIFDAQTSGGLLIAVAPEKLDELLERLRAKGVESAARIGTVLDGTGRIVVE